MKTLPLQTRSNFARVDDSHNNAKRVSDSTGEAFQVTVTAWRNATNGSSKQNLDRLNLGAQWASPPVRLQLVGETTSYPVTKSSSGYVSMVPWFREEGRYRAVAELQNGQKVTFGLDVGFMR